MLQLFNIYKQYRTGTLVQTALNDVTLTLRDNDFVSILGPSGSGKTTLLNIIGGLDRYDSGDLVIDGVSTRMYSGANWDAYRNHSIGFVFQSYNLIPHQSVLANVELALTIGGIKGKERRQKAEEALREVGLGDHMHKRPNQLSGGQMQRVAIARALVNDPKILLADEPTGALDTDTGIQVMDLLKKVAQTRLVIMVTHNNELAEQYSTRIVRLRDGKIIDDTRPITMEEITTAAQQGMAVIPTQPTAPVAEPTAATETNPVQTAVPANDETAKEQPAAAAPKKSKKTPNKSKMGFLTSLSLSFNNLRTKKTRTILTSVAGSIGIIGIALILALSQGVNDYTVALQRDAMESFPISIDSTTYDYSDFDWEEEEDTDTAEAVSLDGKITASVSETNEEDNRYYEPTVKKNNLGALKDYFEDPANKMDEYVGTGSVVYSYSPSCDCYAKDKNGSYLNANSYVSAEEGISSYSYTDMTELPKGRDNNTISKKKKDNYTVVYGDWPEEDNELVIITQPDGTLDAATLVRLGLIDIEEYRKLVKNPELATSGKAAAFTYKEICGCDLTILPESHRYVKDSNGFYKYVEDTDERIVDLIKKYGKKMKVTGIITPVDNSNMSTGMLFSSNSSESTLAYTYKLTNYLIDISAQSEAVKEQLANDNASVFDGYPFNQTEEVTADAVREYFHKMSDDDLKALSESFFFSLGNTGLGMGGTEKEYSREDLLKTIDDLSDKKILEYYRLGATGGYCETLEDALLRLGYATYDKPTSITIYPDTFEGKQSIMKLLEDYNAQADEKDQITYYDFIKDITDGIAQMVFGISMVLIAFVSISLVVSCIMIGIITHISVLERTKEIGILRALGASRGNISQVFNAETFIIGTLAGLIGIIAASLMCIPMNLIINSLIPEGQGTLTAMVPILPAIGLILLSTIITMIGGFIPSMAASRKDPVEALRTE